MRTGTPWKRLCRGRWPRARFAHRVAARGGRRWAFPRRWLFTQAVCTLYAFCGVLFGLCSLASLTVLSAVCCLKVCYPAYGRCWDVLSDLYLHPSVKITGFFFPYGPDPPVLGKLCRRAACSLSVHGAADSGGFCHLCIQPLPPARGSGAPARCARDLCVHLSRPCLQSRLRSGLRSIVQKRIKGGVLPL